MFDPKAGVSGGFNPRAEIDNLNIGASVRAETVDTTWFPRTGREHPLSQII